MANRASGAFGGEVERALEAGMNRGEELVEARQAAGLVLGEVAAPADQDTDGDCRLGG